MGEWADEAALHPWGGLGSHRGSLGPGHRVITTPIPSVPDGDDHPLWVWRAPRSPRSAACFPCSKMGEGFTGSKPEPTRQGHTPARPALPCLSLSLPSSLTRHAANDTAAQSPQESASARRVPDPHCLLQQSPPFTTATVSCPPTPMTLYHPSSHCLSSPRSSSSCPSLFLRDLCCSPPEKAPPQAFHTTAFFLPFKLQLPGPLLREAFPDHLSLCHFTRFISSIALP